MSAETKALVLGIAGLVATLISSALGLFFTSRARTDPLREQLYLKQVELAQQAALVYGRVRTYATILLDRETAVFWEQALADIRASAQELGELTHSSAVLMPTEIYREIQRCESLILDFVIAYEEGQDTENFSDAIAAHSGKVLLLTRAYLGVDELSTESATLFTKRRRLRGLAGMSPEQLAAVANKSGPLPRT